MRTVILGCGSTGVQVGNRLVARGDAVYGVRRAPEPEAGARFPITAGDAADATLLDALPEADAVLIAANPGLRRGRDNRVAAVAAAASERWPRAMLVYTSTTSVYADAGGAMVAEGGAVGDDEASRALLAIELAARRHAEVLVLRVAAIVGPTRTHALERLRRGERVVKGDPDRPFSYVHEDDLARICLDAVDARLSRGVLNVAAPDDLTVRDYYERLARRAGLGAVDITGDGSAQPRRRIDARRLWVMYHGRTWKRSEE